LPTADDDDFLLQEGHPPGQRADEDSFVAFISPLPKDPLTKSTLVPANRQSLPPPGICFD
jgi:hypothetical protein